jgi:Crinkler effector protein N-terminal domain
MGNDTVPLFCLLKGRPLENAFLVRIRSDQYISDLKELIKRGMKPTLDHVHDTILEVYKVSIPRGDIDALQEACHRIEQQEMPKLNSADTIDEAFPSPAKKQTHVIFNVPGTVDSFSLILLLNSLS